MQALYVTPAWACSFLIANFCRTEISEQLVLPQWPPQPCRQRAQRRRGPKIVNLSRTEGWRSPPELVLVKELNIEEALKSPIFVVQKPAAPKNGVEFRQGSIGTIRSSLATSYDVWRRRQFSTNQRPRNYLRYTHTQTDTKSTYCQALLYEQRLQKPILRRILHLKKK